LVYLTNTYLNRRLIVHRFLGPSPRHYLTSLLFQHPLTLDAPMMLHILQFISALVIPALVSAHGFVQQVTIDGTVYKGNNLNVGTPVPSIIRLVSTTFPITGTTNPATNCGQDAQFASLVGDANPGSQIKVLWVGSFDGSTNVCGSLLMILIDV
jgi:hypothetical protein